MTKEINFRIISNSSKENDVSKERLKGLSYGKIILNIMFKNKETPEEEVKKELVSQIITNNAFKE